MAQKDNVALIGMPGAGKSTLGVVLAKVLGYDFVDADLLIQNACGQLLQQVIDERGAEGFLRVEDEVLRGVRAHRTVIATGGSAVYSPRAMAHLAQIATVVYLEVPLDELRERLGGLAERGVVMRDGVGMSLDAIYAERVPLYERYAEATLPLAGLSVREGALRLASMVRV